MDEANETETRELETHDSSITYDVSQISECEPALNSNENLSNNNNPTSEDLNYEILTSRRNDNGIEDFLMSIEDRHVPELRCSWESNFLNVSQITINADANNHHDHDQVEFNEFINTPTLYNINEEGFDERTAELFTHHPYSSPQNRTQSFVRPTEVNETPSEPCSSVSDYDNQHLNREVVQTNENYSFVPFFVYNHPRARLLFDNLGVSMVNSNNLVVTSNNSELRHNVLLNFNYDNEVNNMIYIPELNIYRNSMLNALANENNLMEELYEANRRLNVIHDQQMFDAINNQAANAVEDVVEEMDSIDNIEVLPMPMQEEVPVQPQPEVPVQPQFEVQVQPQPEVPVQPQPEVPVQPQLRLLPFQQLILIANGGITPLNGQYNALLHLIYSNPTLMFLNIRNIILIVHPRILVGGEDNAVFNQNLHWVSVRELLRMNSVILNYENRDSNNGNQEYNEEAGPSNERNR